MRLKVSRLGHACARSRLLREESGIALIMALGIMLVLTIGLTTVITLTAAGARDSKRVNAGQKAYALAEAGVNNAVSVLNSNYPGTIGFPGDSTLLPARTIAYDGGSCTAPLNNCAAWSGVLAGPLVGSPWRWEWRITSTGTVRNPTGPAASPVTRTATAVVPVVIPPYTPGSPGGPLNFLFAGTDMWFENSLNVISPVYVTRDLHLESTSKIKGAAQKIAVGRDLYLKNPQNQIGLTGGSDPRIGEVHVVNKCSSKADPSLHPCGTTPPSGWDTDAIFATAHDGVIPASFLDYQPKLTCCAPYAGAIAPAGIANPSNMGFWYQNSDLGPFGPCTYTNGMPPPFQFDTAGGTADNSINLSATPTTAINLTPSASYTCQAKAGNTILGELSWNAGTRLLTLKGTIFIDGSAYIAPSGVARYTGQGTIVLSGTFGMKNSTICATYAGGCDYTASSPWDPNVAALIIVADGAAGAGGGQGQGSDFNSGEGIELKGADFQGALIANKTIRSETTSQMQGPMISVYDQVWAGQSNDLIFPPILFAPSGGGGIVVDPPKPSLLLPQNFGGG